MLKKALHIVLSLCMALLLVAGTASKEFIHLFADHTDTVHHTHADGLVIEGEHHHCDFLSYHLPPFLSTEAYYSVSYTPAKYVSYDTPCSVQCVVGVRSYRLLRGPPAA